MSSRISRASVRGGGFRPGPRRRPAARRRPAPSASGRRSRRRRRGRSSSAERSAQRLDRLGHEPVVRPRAAPRRLDEPGLADYEADGVRAQERFTSELEKMNDDTESLGKKLDRHAKRMERLKGKSAKKRQRAANRSAKRMNRSAVYIEKRLALLKALVKDIERNYRGLIMAGTIETDDDFQAGFELRNVLDTGRATTEGTLASVAEYRASVEETEALNLSRTVRSASGRLAKALRGIEATFKAHKKASAGLVRDLDKSLDEWRRSQG